MQIVIEIPENRYEGCKKLSLNWAEKAIASGTPLPEDHGRIIDVDKVEVTKILHPKHEYTKGINAGVDHVINAIYNAPAIIEATGVKE